MKSLVLREGGERAEEEGGGERERGRGNNEKGGWIEYFDVCAVITQVLHR